jgi:hypothetical protein
MVGLIYQGMTSIIMQVELFDSLGSQLLEDGLQKPFAQHAISRLVLIIW